MSASRHPNSLFGCYEECENDSVCSSLVVGMHRLKAYGKFLIAVIIIIIIIVVVVVVVVSIIVTIVINIVNECICTLCFCCYTLYVTLSLFFCVWTSFDLFTCICYALLFLTSRKDAACERQRKSERRYQLPLADTIRKEE